MSCAIMERRHRSCFGAVKIHYRGGSAMNTKLMKGIMVLVMVMGLVVPALSVIAAAPLSTEEKTSLIFMREEEKLARDVYAAFSALYPNNRIFKNIAASEQRHMDAIKVLLDRYGIPDPASDTLGVFKNPDIQALYNELIAKGDSLTGALEAGVIIEETDIEDLDDALLDVKHNDIRTVYLNLLNGSYNHLDAFESALARQ